MIEYLIGISADGKQLAGEARRATESLGGIESTAQRMAGRLASVFAFDRLIGMTRATIELGASHDRMAKQLNISAEAAQAFAYAAKQGDASMESIASAIRFLSRAMAEAGESGKGDTFDAFKRFGVGLEEIKALSADQMLIRIADQFSRLPDGVRKTTDAITILGRGADQLFPAFKDGFGKMADEAKNLGVVLSDGAVANLAEAENILKDVSALWEAIKANVVSSAVAMDSLRAARELTRAASESRNSSFTARIAMQSAMTTVPTLGLAAAGAYELRQVSKSATDSPVYQTVSLLRQILKEMDSMKTTVESLL